MNPRIQVMLESRHLEEGAAEEGEVEGLWRKALQTRASSAVAGLDPNARFTLMYQAALQAAAAVTRAAGFRARGEAHHHHTFAAVRDLNVIRRKRHGAIYDWETQLDEHHVVEVRTAADRLFTNAEQWLRSRHPALEPLQA